MSIFLLPFAAPALTLAGALLGFLTPHRPSRMLLIVIEALALSALAVALGSAALLIGSGPGTATLIESSGIGLSARLDIVSAAMLMLVAFIGWVVVRYCRLETQA